MGYMSKCEIWIHVDESCITRDVRVFPFLREEHFPTAMRSATVSDRRNISDSGIDNMDILNKPQIQLFKSRKPAAEFRCIAEVHFLL